ncbi:UDP-N-acetylmuramyl pentapeptide phosphotransferase/UDP-N-acetylglucosamine-1-phosphate transferase [Hymenobacter gelipurpurascens]|uniref:UDP-N-acetylmuramyl pentapeptide phosphotransferase/UDP-N-acetylglucosamine-1-phosphate transferase n=1 Tax=Hymenobacter gelipurpurascens TaxID=89968 RepID=A0A212UH11_9BACT|nr:MraY family glycosyltransferase [Hymenobacter gelipurpurascens]SNC77354.1 UDP-N-acetylmuramyl pentapeptide phosphotransferase/UDP-N-acetylglucosamine-1-phosphate transferase [Hymenobacter gelipurpurascens]
MSHLGIQLGLSSLWAFLVSMFAVPSIIYIAHLKNMLDTPNVRTVHESLTPRLGGVAVFAGFMSALTIFADLGHGIQQLLAGCIVLFFVGLKDDLVSISVAKKFIGQLLATGIVMIMADVRITSFQGILGVQELPVGISYAFTFLVIVGITNAINLIDGLDGLAGTIVLIIVSTFGYYFYAYGGPNYQNYAFVSVCVIGGMLGFLRYNFHKASIFMGDTGSLLCGFIVSILTIQFIEMGLTVGQPFASASPSVAAGILFVPLFDTLRVFTVRMLAGRSPFAPDKNHVHHRILAMGFQQISTVMLLGLLNMVVILFVINFAYLGNTLLIVGLVVFSVLLSFLLGVYQSRSARQRVAS